MVTLRGADAILRDTRTIDHGDLHITDDVVVDAAETGPVLDVSGCVVTPGLVNAHHHLLQSAFRTLPGTRGVVMSEWLQTMSRAYREAEVDPELTLLSSRIGIAESLLSGVTTVADHHLTWPSGGDHLGIASASIAAARELGIRLVFVRGTAGDDPEEAAASAVEIADATQVGPGGVTADGMIQLAVGPAGVHSDGEETFRLMGEVAARYGLRRRTQANEQVDVERAAIRYGRRPLDLLEEWGWVSPDVTLAHLCGITEHEVHRLASSGATATHAPACDASMGWGIAPVRELLGAGVTVGLGTSGGGSNDAGHLLSDARLAMQLSGLVGRPLAALEAFGLATEGSAVGLGRSELGHLRLGARADLCVWDVSGVSDAGVADPIDGLLWASPGRRPRDVMVAGRFVVRDYRLVCADEAELVAALRRRVHR
ncbi:cytosine/adenosine deaminase-related metal-dependent hydrolase [Microbacterium sp. SLBN-154]|nr:cytosine/adenosine deaminase-related metal-dependent hydrolase [Microbacterium sp. SLBN-154]